jgi:hypothetical protein
MNLKSSDPWRAIVIALVTGLVLSPSFAAEPKKPRKSGTSTEPKAGVFEDLPEGEDDKEMKEEATKGDSDKEESAKDEEGFGAGRSSSKKKAPKVDTKVPTEDKEKAKFIRSLQKKFPEKEAVYLLRTIEQGYEKTEDPKEAEAAGLNGYVPYEDEKLEICEGQEEAVAFVLDFVTEYGEPWAKKPKPTGRKKKEEVNPNEPPKPLRDWEIVNYFPDKVTAEAARTEFINNQEQMRQQLEQQQQQLLPQRRRRSW